jgi:hypothetical protein
MGVRRVRVTLKDAAAFIMALPKAKQRSPQWQAAGLALLMAAEDRGPLMHAHIGMLRSLNHGEPKPTTAPRPTGLCDESLDLRQYELPSRPPRSSQGVYQR